MADKELTKEQRILRVLRKVLANIVKDATPAPGTPHLLSEGTRTDIRDLFGLIAEREAELAEETGLNRDEKPYFTDETRTTNVVKIHRPGPKKTD